MAAPVRLASFHQVPVSYLDQQLSDLGSLPLATPPPSAHSLGWDSYRNNSHRSTQRSTDKQGLYEFIDWSSKQLIEDEDDVSRYFEHFQTLSKPLIYFGFISRSEYNQLFLVLQAAKPTFLRDLQ